MKLDQHDNILPLMNFRKTKSRPLEAPVEDPSLPVFEKYFTEHWTSIYRLLARMLGDPAEAEDLALETFYRLYQRRPNPEQEFNAGGWLYRVATNLGYHSIRSFKRREHYEMIAAKDVMAKAPEDSPMEILDKKEEGQMARRALAKMSPRQSQILVLRYSGKAYREIAQALNLSPASIGPLLLRAEREFEKCYHTLEQEDP
jgi:RNA polymerase sigma-70 factor (ECF subfamily)